MFILLSNTSLLNIKGPFIVWVDEIQLHYPHLHLHLIDLTYLFY